MFDVIETHQIVFYFCLFLAPFLQEDVSVLGAATASASGLGDPTMMLFAVSFGLVASASLKYGLGRAANTQKWAKKYIENPKVEAAKKGVEQNMGKSMFIARFVPMARVPLYIAAGFFSTPFVRFAGFVLVAGLLYVALAFGLFHVFGEIAGERMKIYLPIAALGAIVLYLGYSQIKKRRKKQESN